MHSILHRIFQFKTFPTNASKEELHQFFDNAVKEFENGSFLEKTSLPAIEGENEFQQKLHDHRNELLIIKYWKRNCIPCLSVAEMYKEAEKRCMEERLPVRFFSINTKESPNKSVTDYQLVEGTPTIQKYHDFAQVGDDIQATKLEDLMKAIYDGVNAISK